MIGVIQVHVHIKILHNYENEMTNDVYKMYNIQLWPSWEVNIHNYYTSHNKESILLVKR